MASSYSFRRARSQLAMISTLRRLPVPDELQSAGIELPASTSPFTETEARLPEW